MADPGQCGDHVAHDGTPGHHAKKKTLIAGEQDPAAVAAWTALQADLDATTLIFLDETGTSLSMVPQWGWAPRGQRAYGTVPKGHRRHHTLLGALTPSGPGPSLLIEGSIDRSCFDSYLEQWLVPVLKPGQTVIVDNASIHKGPRTRELIESAGATLRFLPTSSPQFNPIESAFAKLKQEVRTVQARTPAALEAAIKTALSHITAADTVGFYRGAGYQLEGQLPCKPL